eukprot:14795068-Alexandrium_andersonii.AAC.1
MHRAGQNSPRHHLLSKRHSSELLAGHFGGWSKCKIQPDAAAVPACPTGQMALSAAPNRRKSETPLLLC